MVSDYRFWEVNMRPRATHTIAFAVLAIGGPVTPVFAQQPSTFNWSAVESALGRKGAMQPQNVIKFSFPRSDLSVSIGGVRIKPALALGGWVAFKETTRGQAVAMGDLVLTEREVGPVMRALQAGGVEQTGL